MRILTLAVLLLIGTVAMAQNKNIYSKKGVAIKGYDVVSYFDGTATKGSEAHAAEHDGVSWHFSSAENLEKFKADPEKFLPEYGGYCAYAIATSGKKVSINPETFEIRDGKLYLFYNSGNTNTLELWENESPEDLRAQADKNWDKIIMK